MSELIFTPWAESHAFTGKRTSFRLLLVKLTIKKLSDPWTDAMLSFQTVVSPRLHSTPVSTIMCNFLTRFYKILQKKKTRIWKHSVKVRASEKNVCVIQAGKSKLAADAWTRSKAAGVHKTRRIPSLPASVGNMKHQAAVSVLSAPICLSWSKPSALWAVRKQHSFTYCLQVRTKSFIYLLSFLVYLKWLGRPASPRWWWFGVAGEREIMSRKKS